MTLATVVDAPEAPDLVDEPAARQTATDGGPTRLPQRLRRCDRPEAVVLAATAAAMGAMLAVGIHRTGHFSYTLDDPLIHLRVAQQIAHGHYGLNPGEASSPSSSALWPFLMAAFAWTGRLLWVPLAVTVACTLASVHLLYATLRAGWARLDPSGWANAAVTGVVVVAVNLTGVAFTGMEHSLHIALSLAALLAVARAAEGHAPRPWTWVVLGVLPLVRYEGLVVAGLAGAALMWFGHRRPVLRSLAGGVAGLVAFSGFLKALGLQALPSSVLVKAGAAENTSAIARLAHQAVDNWSLVVTSQDAIGFALIACTVLLVAAIRLTRPVAGPDRPGPAALRREITMLAFATAVMGIHVTVFALDTFGRYALYASTLGFTAAAASLPGVLGAAAQASAAARTAAADDDDDERHDHQHRHRPQLRACAVAVALATAAPLAFVLLSGPSGLAVGVAGSAIVVGFLCVAAAVPTRRNLLVIVALLLLTGGAPLIARTLAVPADAEAVTDQQVQMHHLAQLLDEPVAANDIGWVAYGNDHYVLDLWGLASEDARVARQRGEPGWVDRQMVEHHVEIAMVYASWFDGEIPSSWITVARLHTAPIGPLAGDTVTIYARTPAARDRAAAALAELRRTLPRRDSITFG